MFLFGTLASLFGPIKYGILPDHLARAELPAGNALIEGGTFLAILLGTILAGIAANGSSNPIHFAWLMMVTALASWLSSLFIPSTGEGAPDLAINRNILASTASLVKELRADPRLWWGAIVASWFWLVGALVLSLLPPLVMLDINGTDAVITVFLTIFSVAVGIGSGLAAWLAAGRIDHLADADRRRAARAVLARSRLDHIRHRPRDKLRWALRGFFASPRGIHIALDLAGLAIAGGLFVVPTFAAVQAWAGADRRARVVAGVNVLNAAFMVVGALFQALLQKLGFGVPILFALLGVANLVVAVAIGRTMPASWMSDFLSIVFRAFYRLEVKGLENVAKAGHNAIIALNHVSFLDPPLAMSLLPKRPVFAIDVAMSRHWWIQPFLKFVRTMALDPLKPFSLRAIINAVRDGDMLVIFPEGRITVTGSLMKIYDGAAMIADKSDAMVVPVRIDGPEATIFSRLKRSQVRRRFFPKITVTILEPVKLKIDPQLKGRRRRQAAGAALYEIMSDLIYRTTPTDRTVVEALDRGGESPRQRLAGDRGPGERPADLPAAVAGDCDPWRQADAAGARRAFARRHAADLQRRGRHAVRGDVRRARAGDDQFHRRRGQHSRRLPRGGTRHHPHLAHFRGKGQARKCRRAPREAAAHRLPGRYPQDDQLLRQAPRPVALEEAAGRAQARRLGGDPVHLRHGRAAQGRRALSPQPADQCGAVRGPHRFRTRGQAVQCAAGVPLVRLHRRDRAAADFRRADLSFIPRRCTIAPCPELVYGVCATVLFGTDTFLNGYARMANPYDFRSLRYVLAGAEPVREIDAPDFFGKVRAAHSRRLWRDRDVAGAGAEHADVQQVRQRRPAACPA